MTIVTKVAMAAVAALTIAGSSVATTSSADARPGFRGSYGGHHGGYHHGFRGRGFGVGAGIATGLALGGLGYYAYNGYGYGGCYLERRLFVDQWGRQFVRPVRVCS